MNIDLSQTFIYIINNDLKMSKGKIAAQVSHVACQLGAKYRTVGKAIVLKADEETLLRIVKHFTSHIHYVRDAGLTQVPEGSLTCVGFKETPFTYTITKRLKLL
jgi:peptidyl-tRNA hydrolase